MNGILCIDKPAGFTSFDVVAKLRGMAQTKKVGHGGTLDPMATGVLPIFFGQATKASDRMPCQDKRYIASFRLGYTTDTQDDTGTVLTRLPVHAQPDTVFKTLESFVGCSQQIPPMFSAVRVDGQRLYDLARQGLDIARPAREIEIYSIDLLEVDAATHTYTIDVFCAKGTFIRTLCHDVGQALGCGATMLTLRRTQACGYKLEQCITLEQAQTFTNAGTLSEYLLPVETVFATLPSLTFEQQQATHFINGVQISLHNLPPLQDGQQYTIFGPENVFLGLAEAQDSKNRLKILKLFARRDTQ